MLKKAAMISNLNQSEDNNIEFTDMNNNLNVVAEENEAANFNPKTEEERTQ